MRKKHLLSVLSLLFPLMSFAQNGTLKGIVTDGATKETIVGATIIADDTSGAASDINGVYTLQLMPGTHSISLKYMGYQTFKQTVSILAGQTTALDIILKSEATELGTVVVSAGKFEQRLADVTVSMEVLKPYLTQNTNTTNMETAIDQTPGVNVTDGNASIRGGSGFSYGAGSRVLVLVDDLPLLTADAGDVKWSFLPIENLEQVEVIKGASSALFGSSALNGVINLRTAYPRDKPETKITAFSGIFDNPPDISMRWWKYAQPAFTGVNFSHSRKAGNWDIVAGGNLFSDEGYRQGETEQRYRFNLNIRKRSKKTEGLSYGVNTNMMYAAGGNFLIWQNDSSGAYKPFANSLSNYITKRINVDPFITYIAPGGSIHKMRTRIFYTANGNDSQQESFALLAFGEYQFSREFSAQRLTFSTGLTGVFSTVKGDLYNEHTSSNIALYAQADKKLTDKLSLSMGLRAEQFSIDSTALRANIDRPFSKTAAPWVAGSLIKPVLRAGLNYRAFKETYLRTSFGQGYRYPTIAERYVKTRVGSFSILPNDTLQAEAGWSAEAGIKQGLKIGKWLGYADAALFWSEYQNMIEFNFVVDKTGSGFKSLNVGNTKVWGFDVSLAGEGNIGKTRLRVLAGYTYMDPVKFRADATSSDSGSVVLKYRYRHIAKADVEATLSKWSLGISFRYNSFMENIDRILLFFANEYRKNNPGGDYVFDGRLSYQMTDACRVALVTKNILNRVYMGRPADMQPPRSFTVQLAFNF